ncbi:MAG: RNA-binding domain-containing protein [Pyrinomonadaceae bacterium]
MTDTILIAKLNEFRAMPDETECVEFKEAKTKFDVDKLGQYFSALSNEANLKDKECGWLIFGVKDNDKSIVSSEFRRDRKHLDKLKGEISAHTSYRIGFVEIYELSLPEDRVLMFQIPKAQRGMPTAWKGHYYGRDGDDTGALSEEKRERIRKQKFEPEEDWSAGICVEATLDDLDPRAILRARELFKQKFSDEAAQADRWSDEEFLNKAKITIKGKITRAAIVLLGKSESEYFISPAVAKLRWILKDSKGIEKDYLIANCPFILTVDKIYAKIRNVTYRREMRENLFPEELAQYSPDLIYEALNNCIAHQDYFLKGRINIVEKEDELIFTNLGEFIPGSVETVVKSDTPAERYKNAVLAEAMFNFKMIQTRGGGIRMMFNEQRRRLFPMPEYDLSEQRVKVTITGKILDPKYANVLAQENDLTLDEIIMLDRVQKDKGKSLSAADIKHLRKRGLIEGTKPNYFISAQVAQKTNQKAAYSKFRGLDKSFYLQMITNALGQHKQLTRSEIDQLLLDKLPDLMNEKQKKRKIGNLLSELRIKSVIKNIGSDFKPVWILTISPQVN